MLSTAYAHPGPTTVRYPRGAGVGRAVGSDLDVLPWGKAEVRRQGRRLAVLAFGPLLYEALKVAEQLDLTVVNMRWAKPLDVDLLRDLAKTHEGWVTLEEGSKMGGAGSAVMEALHEMSIMQPVLCLGLPDVFTEHGDPAGLMQEHGLDAAGIQKAIEARWPGLSGSNVVALKRVR